MESTSSLHFLGQRQKRALPWDLEALVYSCLPLDESSTIVYRVSRGWRAQIVRYLRQLRHLQGFRVCATAHAPVLALTLQHCQSVQTVRMTFWSPHDSTLENRWLARLLERNRSESVRHVTLPQQVRIDALSRCELLEEFAAEADPFRFAGKM